jgi:hypothetical protein
MARYVVTAPDGSKYEITAPDSASEADVLAYAKRQFSEQVPAIEKPAAVRAGEFISGIPRQVGLWARYGIEGPAQVSEIVTEPLRKLIVNPTLGALGLPQARSTGQAATSLADTLGLPNPEGANERVVGDASRFAAGGFGMAKAAQAAGNVTRGVTQKVFQALAANPVQQAISGAGAGGAGGAVREAGGGPWSQAGGALLGGLAAPMAANAVSNAGSKAVNWLKTAVTPQKVIDQQIDQQLTLTLKQAGVDYAGLSERIKQGMREVAADAIRNNKPLDPAAVARMVEFSRLPEVTPTQGMVSQNPVQITREKNLAKIGANSTDIGLNRLSNLESENTAALLRNLDQAGAANAPDAYTAGQRGIEALSELAAARKAQIDALYQGARDTAGRSLPLDGAAWTRAANAELDAAMVGGALPADVATVMNKVARGEMPFTVEIAEQIKTRIGALQRASSDGQTRIALGIVRKALDNTPLKPSPSVNPGNLPAVPGTVPQNAQTVGQESIDAFNRARRANRVWMQQVERTPALEAVMNGIEPDRFVSRFITGTGATVADVQALRRAANANPQALQAIKNHLVAHLKGAATGQAGDINKFRADSYNNALNAIGERKLAAFFTADEIAQLRAIGRVSNYMTAQPAGTAVNNSNSGALVAAKALDALDAIAGRMPLGLDTMIQGIIMGTQQRQATNLPPGLLQVQPRQIGMESMVSPALFGGLLAAQPADNR